MDATLIAALVSALVTVAGLLFAYRQWHRDYTIRVNRIREEVSIELIRQRMKPYSTLMKQLEIASSLYWDQLTQEPGKV